MEKQSDGSAITRPKRLDDFVYGKDMETSAELFKNLAEVSFHGVSVCNLKRLN